MTETTYPVSHLSYSALSLFLRNPYMFKKNYILNIWDFKYSASALAGKAGHKALELYYKGEPVHKAIEAGLALINKTPDSEIEFGKTGSREKIIKTYNQAIQWYLEEEKINRKDILGIEKSITTFFEMDDIVKADIEKQEFGLPAKAVSDLIVRNEKGKIDIIDHKFCSSYTQGDKDKGLYVLQALFNYHTVKSEYKEVPERMIFNELKVTKNTDGSPQLQPYIIEFAKHPDYFGLFYNIYNQVTRTISNPSYSYLPNFNDAFDNAGETFDDYKNNVITIESPVMVEHKTKDVQLKDTKFIESEVDIVDNQHLPNEEKIRMKLLEFGIAVEMRETYTGASVIQYTFKPSRGTRMSQFEKLGKDLAIVLKAKTIRIQAPIMGTDVVGVEIPNPERQFVNLPVEEFEQGSLTIPIGVDVYGTIVKKRLDEMPHLLVAGATGAGKSVMIHVILKSLTEQNTPEELSLLLIDPKRVELGQYKNLPHLLEKPIYDENKANIALDWLVDEMEHRYNTLEQYGVRDIDQYNKENTKVMKKIVVVIDEFADLILQSKNAEPTQKRVITPDGESEIMDRLTSEKAIIRLAQKSRAVGIHLVLGTQRPSVDVVTGLIKANMPTRIAFATSSRVDSQVILDEAGAETLIGKGDMLFLDPHKRYLQRLQGFYFEN